MKKLLLIIVLISFITGCSESEKKLKYTGTAETTKYDVTAEVSGTIKEIYVDEGDRVRKGEMLAKLDDTDLKYAVLRQEAAYNSMKEQLEEVQRGSRNEEIRIAEQELKKGYITLEMTENKLKYTEEIYNDTKELFNNGGVSEQELKDKRLKLDLAQSDMENAKTNLDLLSTKLQLLKAGATEEQVKSKAYIVKEGNYGYQQAKFQREKTNIATYNEGIILYKNYNEGEFITVGTPVFTIANPDKLWFKIYVPEKEIHLFKVGDRVSISSDMVKEKILGKIVFISPQAEYTPANVTTKEDRHNRVHEIKINILEGTEYIRPGMVLDVLKKNIN